MSISGGSLLISTYITGKVDLLFFESTFDDIKLVLDTLADEKGRLSYQNILKYIVKAKLVEGLSRAIEGADEIDHDGHVLFSFDEISLDLLMSGCDGIDSLDQDLLNIEINKKHSDNAHQYLLLLQSLKSFNYRCDSYTSFLKHPLWRTYPFSVVKRPYKISEIVTISGDNEDVEIHSKMRLETLKMYVNGKVLNQTDEELDNQDEIEADEISSDEDDVASLNFILGVDDQDEEQDFYEPRNAEVQVKGTSLLSSVTTCPRCGSDMVLRNGRYGDFYGCSQYPECKGTRDLNDAKNSNASIKPVQELNELLAVEKIKGRAVAITGDINGYTRDEITEYLSESGAQVKGSVSSKTDLLIVGNDPGKTKLDAAYAKQIELMDLRSNDQLDQGEELQIRKEQGFTLKLNDDVTGKFTGKPGSLVLVDCFGENKKITVPEGVTHIASEAFNQMRTTIESVTLPDSIVTIMSEAFSDCIKLKDVRFPNSINRVAGFQRCTSLTRIAIPESVEEIDQEAFDGCSSLIEVVFPSSMKVLNGFKNCTSLSEIRLPKTVDEIGSGAFSGCKLLTSITFPLALKKLDGFKNCTSLTHLEISSAYQIGYWAFFECSSLTEVVLPNGLVELLGFRGCTSLTQIKLPRTLKVLDGFRHCSQLAKIDIPDSIEKIGISAFQQCDHLQTIRVPYYNLDDYPNYPFQQKQYKDTYLITFPNPLNSNELFEVPLPRRCGVEGADIDQLINRIDTSITSRDFEEKPYLALFRLRSQHALQQSVQRLYRKLVLQNIVTIIYDLVEREGLESLNVLITTNVLTIDNSERILWEFESRRSKRIYAFLKKCLIENELK